MAAQEWNDNTVAFGSEQGRHVDEAVDVVRPAVQQDHGGPFSRTGFGIADVQYAGIDLL